MSGWDARQWANVILTGFYVLVGLGFLLWRPKPGQSWWSWGRPFGAAIVILALVFLFVGPGQTRGGLINHGIVMIAISLWFLFAGVWSVNGPDLPPGTVLRRNFRVTAFIFLYGGIAIALGLSLPR